MINGGKTVAVSFHTKQNTFPLRFNISFINMDIAYKF